MLDWLAHWNNWPFLLSLMIGVGLVLLTLLGFSKEADHGVDADHDFDHDAGHASYLGFIGVGKVPLSILIEVLFVSFGLTGLLVNAVARDLLGGAGVLVFPVSFFAALVGAVFATKGVAAVITRYAPADGPTSRRAGEFVGSTATAASLITRAIGQVRVERTGATDPAALLNAQLDPEWDQLEIQRGTEVLLVGYDRERRLYRVRPLLTD